MWLHQFWCHTFHQRFQSPQTSILAILYNEFEGFSSKSNIDKTNLFFILEQSLKKRNLAETVFIVIDLLNSSKKEELNFYYLYKSIYALNNIGLREYAREFALEINLGL